MSIKLIRIRMSQMRICAVKNCTDFDVSLLRLHQLIDDLAEFVCVGELSLSGGACCGR